MLFPDLGDILFIQAAEDLLETIFLLQETIKHYIDYNLI